MKVLFNNFSLFLVVVTIAVTIGFIEYDNRKKIERADFLYSQLENKYINDYYNNYDYDQNIFEKQNRLNTLTPPKLSSDDDKQNNDLLADLVIPTFENGVDAYMFAEKVLKLASDFHIVTTGKAKATMNIEQKIRAEVKKDNFGNFYGINVSHSSFAKTGMEVYYNGRQIKYRMTEKVSSDLDVNFSNSIWKPTTIQNYISTFGLLPTDLNYIVNKDTVLQEKNFKFEDGKYSFTLVLNPDTSTENYKKNIKEVSGSKSYPKFSKVELSVVINKDARFEKIIIREEYKVTAYGITSPIDATLTLDFKTIHGSNVQISVPSGF